MTESSAAHPWARVRPPVPAHYVAKSRAGWLAPTGLILLSLVPVVAGAFRLTELTSGAAVTPENARFFDSPVPVVVHIVASSVFLMLGALQFAPSLRRRSWHRIAGRIVAPAGLLSATSALWMTLFYALPASNGPALLVMRLVFGTAMAAGIVVAFVAIRRGDIRTHSAWMTRAVCDRPRRRNAGVHVPLRDAAVRRTRRGHARGAHGRRVGDQPRRGGGRHPPSGRALRPRVSRTSGRPGIASAHLS